MRSSILSVRQATGALRAALLNPSLEGMQASLPELQQAAVSLQQIQSPDESCRAELRALLRELHAAARLTAQGLGVTRGTLRLLAATDSGYRPDGEPEPLNTVGTLLVRG